MIPNKSNFKFQELTPITGVKPYVLRFWETEFEDIAPLTSDKGEKLYARKDVEAILKIKKLLFDEKLSIQQAKAAIKSRDISLEEVSVEVNHVASPGVAKEAIMDSLNIIRDIKLKRNW